MTANDDTTAIDALPPEILQAVWSYLPLNDLLRCQRVCKKWNAYLPGNNSTLRNSLFSPHMHGTTSIASTVIIWIVITQHLECSPMHLPRTQYSIDFETPGEMWTNRPSLYHPIVMMPGNFSGLVHPKFKPESEPSGFVFYDFDDVEVLGDEIRSKGATWEKMTASVPKAQELDIEVQWRLNESPDTWDFFGSRHYETVENPDGVTVLDVVRVLRKLLKKTKSQLLAHCNEMDQIKGYFRTG